MGILFVGLAIDLIAFPSNLGANPAQLIPADAIRNLGLIYGPIAATVGIVAGLAMLPYKLDREQHARIRTELARRKGEG